MLKFSFDEALSICERKLHRKYNYSLYPLVTGRDCYYYDSRCELGFDCTGTCMYYVNDINFTNLVRRNILHNPRWVRENWDMLCTVDKELYCAIHKRDGSK